MAVIKTEEPLQGFKNKRETDTSHTNEVLKWQQHIQSSSNMTSGESEIFLPGQMKTSRVSHHIVERDGGMVMGV